MSDRTYRPILTIPTPKAASWNQALLAMLSRNRRTPDLTPMEIQVANALRGASATPRQAFAAIVAIRES